MVFIFFCVFVLSCASSSLSQQKTKSSLESVHKSISFSARAEFIQQQRNVQGQGSTYSAAREDLFSKAIKRLIRDYVGEVFFNTHRDLLGRTFWEGEPMKAKQWFVEKDFEYRNFHTHIAVQSVLTMKAHRIERSLNELFNNNMNQYQNAVIPEAPPIQVAGAMSLDDNPSIQDIIRAQMDEKSFLHFMKGRRWAVWYKQTGDLDWDAYVGPRAVAETNKILLLLGLDVIDDSIISLALNDIETWDFLSIKDILSDLKVDLYIEIEADVSVSEQRIRDKVVFIGYLDLLFNAYDPHNYRLWASVSVEGSGGVSLERRETLWRSFYETQTKAFSELLQQCASKIGEPEIYEIHIVGAMNDEQRSILQSAIREAQGIVAQSEDDVLGLSYKVLDNKTIFNVFFRGPIEELIDTIFLIKEEDSRIDALSLDSFHSHTLYYAL